MRLISRIAIAMLLLTALSGSAEAQNQDQEQRIVEDETLRVGLMKARSAVRIYRGLIRSQNMPSLVDGIYNAAIADHLLTEYLNGAGSNDPAREDIELIQMVMNRLSSDIGRDIVEQGPPILRRAGPQFSTFLELAEVRLDTFTSAPR